MFSEKQILRDVSFHIKEGERVGFIGLNGSGKTTLMRILMGNLRADSGYVRVAGEKPWELPGKKKVRIGVVSAGQSNLHQDRTVEESVNLCRKMYPDAWACLNTVSREQGVLSAKLCAGRNVWKISGWDLEIMDYVVECLQIKDFWKEIRSSLSPGERMRAEFLYAIMMNPYLLIMDEPTTGMDYGMRTKEYDCLEQLNKQRKDMPINKYEIDIVLKLAGAVLLQGAVLIFAGALSFRFVRSLAVRNVFIYKIREFIDYPISIYPKVLQVFLTMVVPYGFVNFYPVEALLNKQGGILPLWLADSAGMLLGVLSVFLGYCFFMSSVKKYQSTGS